jgi:hypothetical protein
MMQAICNNTGKWSTDRNESWKNVLNTELHSKTYLNKLCSTGNKNQVWNLEFLETQTNDENKMEGKYRPLILKLYLCKIPHVGGSGSKNLKDLYSSN